MNSIVMTQDDEGHARFGSCYCWERHYPQYPSLEFSVGKTTN